MHLRYIQRSLPVKDTLKCKQTNNKNIKDFKVRSSSKFSRFEVSKIEYGCSKKKFENVAIENLKFFFKISSDEFKGIGICYKIYAELSDR